VSWLLAFLGFAALVILHEAGHFTAAKAVGMRVERFALFFPPLIARVRRGETEYAVGAIPLGGYVKISGMSPNEELAPDVAHRAYYRQPVWKRIVVISAGPFVNLVIAFAILWGLFLVNGIVEPSQKVHRTDPGYPAQGVLLAGDEIVAIDGVRGAQRQLATQIATHTCAGEPRAGCVATTAARVTIVRDGTRQTIELRPTFDPRLGVTRLGFSFGTPRDVGALHAAGLSLQEMWAVTSATVMAIVRIFDPEVREELSSVVGSYEVTRQAFELSTERALLFLAIISLSLGVINLFPFLPLDGGHIFWALAEKVRGRAIPFEVMERAGLVGFVLVITLFLIGLSNDIGRLTGEGFNVR
jgi:regulator of sigma E protease